jgi:hypothetical protein
MNKKYFIALITIVLLVIVINQVSAACAVAGWTKDKNGKFVSSNIVGVCSKTGESEKYDKNPGVNWLFSYGGPLETCETRCGTVIIVGTATEENSKGISKRVELTSSNMKNWNETSTKNYNITLEYTSRAGTTKIPNQDKIINTTKTKKNITVNGQNNGVNDEPKHINNSDASNNESIIKDWMIYLFIGIILSIGILAFLLIKNKKMGGKI